ncbi:MAG: 2-oxo acid dehydrogenase subunit E2 [Spirochaetes bacterium]|nr:2-oxo acid dehydrogenase subunit E2 [Spirochaetota bacterium]
MKQQAHSIRAFPASRLFTIDIGRLAARKHYVQALLEIDVTKARTRIRGIKRAPGAKISFTSWFIACVGRALAEHGQVHALRKGRAGLVLFDDVDLSLLVEKEVDGVPVPLPLVIRAIDKKSIADIYVEIERAKKTTAEGEGALVIGQRRESGPVRLYALMPGFLRMLVWRLLLRNPFRIKRMMGTAVLTSVGMMGAADGWVVPTTIHPVCFALGSITRKGGEGKGKPAIREYLKMTILFDHDVVDGAPAARFTAKLVELLEDGYGV